MNIVNAFMATILELIFFVLNLYIWVLIVSAVLSWLVAFDIVNTHNRFVRMIGDFTYRLTEPVLRPIRRVVPTIGGMDLSGMVLILIIWFIQSFIRRLVLG